MHVCICVSKLKLDLFESLEKRFGDLIETDLCLISAFLDPRFGPKVFTAQKREMVKMRVKYHLALIVPRNNVQTHIFSEKVSYFMLLKLKQVLQVLMNMMLKQYVDCVSNQNFDDPLLFWKNNFQNWLD